MFRSVSRAVVTRAVATATAACQGAQAKTCVRLSTTMSRMQTRSLTAYRAPNVEPYSPVSTRRRRVTLIRGDGIGPEVTSGVVSAFTAMRAPIDWEAFELPCPFNEPDATERVTSDIKDSIQRNKFVLKGPLYTPQGKGFTSPDVSLARHFGLYAHVVPVQLTPGVQTRHDNVDMVVIRENTEGEYSGLEHQVNNNVVQSLKVITRKASRNIAEYAFRYALANGRKKVTAVHKANIMKKADGLFLKCCREVAGLYHGKVDYNEMIIDNTCMQLVSRPEQFDVVVTGNLYGNIVSESAAGLAGGVGLIPGYNYSNNGIYVYEQGCRHIGMDIAMKNLANPTSFMRSAALMLRHMQLAPYGAALEKAISETYAAADMKVLTPDVGGTGTSSDFVQAVVDRLEPVDPALVNWAECNAAANFEESDSQYAPP
jgi:isocitrate dehydrogenase (NAD+)